MLFAVLEDKCRTTFGIAILCLVDCCAPFLPDPVAVSHLIVSHTLQRIHSPTWIRLGRLDSVQLR